MSEVKTRPPAKTRNYYVGFVNGAGDYGYADTLEQAKTLGMSIAKKNIGRGKWNVRYGLVAIDKQARPGFYISMHLYIAVPVRGSGARYAKTVEEIKRQYGVPPMRWFKW